MVCSFGESLTADDTEVVPPSNNQYVSGQKLVILLPWRAGLCPGRVQKRPKGKRTMRSNMVCAALSVGNGKPAWKRGWLMLPSAPSAGRISRARPASCGAPLRESSISRTCTLPRVWSGCVWVWMFCLRSWNAGLRQNYPGSAGCRSTRYPTHHS